MHLATRCRGRTLVRQRVLRSHRWPRSCIRRLVLVRWFAPAWVLLCVAGAALATTASAQTAPPTPQSDPGTVVEAFERARGAADVDSALALFSDSAVISMQGRTTEAFTGPNQLRTYMQTIGTRFQIVMRSRPLVQGNTVTWTERDMFFGRALDATVVAVVTNGRIVSLAYRDSQLDASRAELADAGPQPLSIPAIAWPIGLAVVSGLLLGIVFGRPRRKASVSHLDGRLLLALQQQRERDAERKAA